MPLNGAFRVTIMAPWASPGGGGEGNGGLLLPWLFKFWIIGYFLASFGGLYPTGEISADTFGHKSFVICLVLCLKMITFYSQPTNL